MAIRFKQLIKFLFFTIIPVILIVEFRCSSGKKTITEKLPGYAGLEDSVKYVGINTCKECHESIYNSFIKTGMGKSFENASRKKSSAIFDKHALVYDKNLDFYYHPFWDNDSLKVTEFRLKGKDTIHQRTETVSYIVGSGQHTNSHMVNTGGYLHQVPVTFYTQKARWDLAPGFENGNNTRFGRMIGLECMSCHNAYPDFVMGSENKYQAVQQGINCERCHGPGSTHVQLKREGKLVDISKEIDYSIVNPAKLPVNLQFDVCQRCHIQGNAILNENKSFFDFRPGMPLSDVMNVFMPLYKGREEEHIMASHAERLKQSKCYLETIKRMEKQNDSGKPPALRPHKNALTCITCHNPHISVKETGNDTFNNACKQCHQSGKDALCTDLPLHLKSAENNCISCHMPASGATDIPHVRVTDHKIRIPLTVKEINDVKQFVGIACINNPDPPKSAIAKAFIAYYEKFSMDISMLDSARKYLDDQSPKAIKNNFHDLIQLSFLKNDFLQISKYIKATGNPLLFLNRKSYSNADAWCCYRIAEAFTSLNLHADALQYYERATLLAPYEMDFQNKLGASLISNNQPERSIAVYKYIIGQDSRYFKAYSNLGFLLLTRHNDVRAAMDNYNKALSLSPDYEGALLNKAGLYIYTNQINDAIVILKQIIKKHPDNSKAKQLLNQISSNS